MSKPALLILAPAAQNAVYTQFIRQFVDLGVHFSFADDYALPRELPSDLAGVRCLMLDPTRRAEFEQEPVGARLREFERRGGFVFWPDLTMPAGGSVGDNMVRHNVLRIINATGLPTYDPAMLARMQGMDESVLVAHCKGSTADELGQYARMGSPFCDPVGMWTMPTAIDAAEFFGEPALADPVWEHIATHYGKADGQPDRHGIQHFLDYGEKTGDRRPLEHLAKLCAAPNSWPHLWRKNGVFLNCDLHVPNGCDPDRPPGEILRNAWVWPETNLWVGETLATLTRATGDCRHLDRALTHVLEAHRWLFEPQSALDCKPPRYGTATRTNSPPCVP